MMIEVLEAMIEMADERTFLLNMPESFTLKTGKLEHAGIFVVGVSSSYFGKGEKN
jgi:hypothetical protein